MVETPPAFGGNMREGILSFTQELLLHSEILLGRAPIISRLVRVTGKLDVSTFGSAAHAVIAAHEPLRSICVWHSGQPLTKALAALDSEPAFWAEQVTSFDEAKFALLRAYSPAAFSSIRVPKMLNSVVRVEPDVYLWAFGMHHIAADAISIRLYGDTFGRHYAGSSTATAATTSIDYAQTQRKWFLTSEAQTMYEWWDQRIENTDPGPAPVRISGTVSIPEHHRLELRIALGGRNAILSRAREWRVPTSAIFFAAFAVTAAARQRTTSVTVLTNVPGRSLSGASTATGAFYNTVPLTIPLKGADPHSIALSAAEALFEVLERQEVPIALLHYSKTRRGGAPLATLLPVSLNVIEHPLACFRLPGCRIHEIDARTLHPPTWDRARSVPLGEAPESGLAELNWLVTVLPDVVVVGVEYDSSVWDTDDARCMLDEYGQQISFFLGCDAGDASGDPALIADWSNL